MSYFISIKLRKSGAYTNVTVTSDLGEGTLMDSKELHLLKSELEEVLEELTSVLPEGTE
jgi:hypothetical protein